jgi:hypothetical protein
MLALALALALATTTGALPATATPQGQRGRERPPPLPQVEATWEHDLSTATGTIALTWPTLAYDRARAEVYVVADGFVRIFNATGMEIHRFGEDGAMGAISRVAVLEDGNIVTLSRTDAGTVLHRCDYRGDPIVRFGLTGVPQAFADLQPDFIVARNGRLYLAEAGRARVVVTDPDGAYRQSFRLDDLVARALPSEGGRKVSSGIDGFGVDPAGNLLATMSMLFTAMVVSPSGEVRLFGSRGSTPGRFNNVGGIDADERGNIFVTDRLRSVVSVWTPDLRHLADFGYRGWGSSNLLTPYDIVVGNEHVYVSQAGQRGVKAFRVALVAPPPPPSRPPPGAPPQAKGRP